MDSPWGIPGPQFVWVYLGLLIVPLVVRGFLRSAAKRVPPRAAHGYDRYPLSVYHLAYLAGGPNRTVETVIAAMVERGRLRVNSGKKLKAVGVPPSDPLERAVWDASNDAIGSGTLGVQNWARSSDPMKALRADLERRGLVVPGTRFKRIGRAVVWLYVAVLAVGVARLVNGLSLDRPVGLLGGLLIVNLVVLVITGSRSSRHDLVLTPAGDRVLGQARAESGRTQHATSPSPGSWAMPLGGVLVGAAGVVALGGLAMHPDRDLGLALAPPPMSGGGGSSSGGDSGGSSCSSGSSCGGGGCGGGCGG
jgi:uncharacterized protein (TIGR04222 family)